jgi:two-component system CheB/CheR fusion protein
MELRGPIEEAFRQRRSQRVEDQEYRLTAERDDPPDDRRAPALRARRQPYAVLLAFIDTTRGMPCSAN